MSERIFIESLNEDEDPYSYGIMNYKFLADEIIRDLDLGNIILRMRILVDIHYPFFGIHVILGPPLSPITLSQVATINVASKTEILIRLTDETHASDLLALLWEKFRKDNVNQLDRFENIVTTSMDLNEIKNLLVVDPNERKRIEIFDAVNRIIPEGFRVKYNEFKGSQLLVVGSENPITAEVIEKIKEALKKKPSQIPREILEEHARLKKTKGERRTMLKPWKQHIGEI